jgi:NAD(P)-dependent dehydrogenase (short-subunit alcohol dehydrogenase family)
LLRHRRMVSDGTSDASTATRLRWTSVATGGTMADVERIGGGVVIRPRFDPVARPFESLTDHQWHDAWERPVRDTVTALQQAHRDGAQRIVVVVPVISMSGGARYSHVAAPAEAIRVLVKSAARQWGTAGVTVNAVAIAAEAVLESPSAAGPVSIAPTPIDSADPTEMIRFLCSEAAGHVTGQTITVDGGAWM